METIKPHASKIVFGLVFVLFVLFQVFTKEEEQPILLPPNPMEDQVEVTYIYVDIKGEVYYPGVYKVLTETRLFQVVELAGGFTSNADALAINLSRKLYDQSVVYIPHIDEDYQSAHEQEDSSNAVTNINVASLEELMDLPGVGEVTATAIIQYRQEMGGFSKIEDLMNVPGIGEATFERLKELIAIS